MLLLMSHLPGFPAYIITWENYINCAWLYIQEINIIGVGRVAQRLIQSVNTPKDERCLVKILRHQTISFFPCEYIIIVHIFLFFSHSLQYKNVFYHSYSMWYLRQICLFHFFLVKKLKKPTLSNFWGNLGADLLERPKSSMLWNI